MLNTILDVACVILNLTVIILLLKQRRKGE